MITVSLYYNEDRHEFESLSFINDKFVCDTFTLDKPLISITSPNVILKSEYTDRDEYTESIWNCYGVFKELRFASINNMGLGYESLDNTDLTLYNKSVHIMGYDIECTNDGLGISLPLPTDRITCTSISCSCGYEVSYFVSLIDISGVKVFSNDIDLIIEMHKDIITHSPQWLTGYNCYSFDNIFMSFKDPSDYYLYLPRKNASGGPSLAFYYPGINNIDTYTYIEARYRSMFSSLSLLNVAKTLKLRAKTDMPSHNDVSAMILYNLNDSRIVREVFVHLSIDKNILATCTVMKSCLYDIVRNATGVMAASMLSNYTLQSGKVMDWSKCSIILDEFKGGMVYDPIVGIHKNVCVVDFKSMYPNIMLSACISHDNVTIEKTNDIEGNIVWSNDKSVSVTTGGNTAIFKHNTDCIAYKVLKALISFREKYGSKDKHLSDSIKGATNSIFGALGFVHSPIYSPMASRSITCIARYLLATAKNSFEKGGMTVLYGDTDSLFVSSNDGSNVINDTKRCLADFHAELLSTPFSNMELKFEGYFTKFISVKKKSYALVDDKGNVSVKGLASRRKDRKGIVINAYNRMLSLIANYEYEELDLRLGILFCDVLTKIAENRCTTVEVSSEVKIQGVSCYRYVDNNKKVVEIEMEDCPLSVQYDVRTLLEDLVKTCDKIILICTNKTVADLTVHIIDIDLLDLHSHE